MPPRHLTRADIEDLGLDPETLDLPEQTLLGQGLCARVHLHPRDPGLVLRVSRPLDGWIGHALAADGAPHAPRVEALGFLRNRWIAVAERLQPWPEPGMAQALREVLAGGLDEVAGQPGLAAHARAHLGAADDLRDANIMARGATVVVNDPFTLMGAEAFALMDLFEADEPASGMEMEP